MKPGECAAFDGLRLAELIAKKDTTPRELGACVLAGVAKLNPQLNAVVEMYDDAVEALGEEPAARRSSDAIYNAIAAILPNISPDQCRNFFTHAGYGQN
jgi:hypothetical protein